MAEMPERVWIGWEHAPDDTHDGRDGSCTRCPVPVLHGTPGNEARAEYIRADRYDELRRLAEAVLEESVFSADDADGRESLSAHKALRAFLDSNGGTK